MIKAVIFDLDGVLIDAADWHFNAFNRALNLFGHNLSKEEHHLLYNGLPTSVKLQKMTDEKLLPKGLHSFINEMKQQFTKQIIESNCCPDIKTTGLLRYLKARGYKIAVATNSLRETLDLILGRMAIREYFDVTISREEVGKPKPSADIYKECLRLLKIDSTECLIVEDSPFGLQAAKEITENIIKVNNPKEVTVDLILNHLKKSPSPENKITLEVIVPMAGLGQRFKAVGYPEPKPFIPVMGKPMIEWVVENTGSKKIQNHFTFICNKAHLTEYPVTQLFNRMTDDYSIVSVPNTTEGAACTVLLSIDTVQQSNPLLLVNSDQWVDVDIDTFLSTAIESQCDGMIMTFQATEKKWSYAKTNESGRVIEVAEKKAISPHATVGIYYFRQARDFFTATKEMIRKDTRTNGEFYVCPVYNELIQMGKDIRIYEIPATSMHGLGTPEDLNAFLNFKKAA